VKLWDVATGKEAIALRGHTEAVWRVAYSPDGRRLFSSSHDGTIRVWDATPLEEMPDSQPLMLSGHAGRINCVVFSPDNRYLASAGMDGRIILWDAQSGRKIQQLPGNNLPVHSLAFSPDGKRLAAVGRQPTSQFQQGTPPPVRIWELSATKEACLQFPCLNDWGSLSVAFSPDGRWLASADGGEDTGGFIQLFDAATGEPIRAFSCPGKDLGRTGVAFSVDGKRLAGVDVLGHLAVFEVPAGFDARMLGLLQVPPTLFHFLIQTEIVRSAEAQRVLQACPGRVYIVAYSNDDRWLATAGIDGLIQLWDAKTVEKKRVLRGHQGSVNCIAFSRDSKYLVSVGYDAVVHVWDMTSGAELLALGGPTNTLYSVAISPDNRRVAAAGIEPTVFLWEVHQLLLAPPNPARAEAMPPHGLFTSPQAWRVQRRYIP
jgi:WD40 repeat protein